MTPIRIKLLVDLEGIEFEEVDGYLVDSENAFYITEFGELWVLSVTPTEHPDVFLQSHSYVELGIVCENSNGIKTMTKIYERLMRMTGWEFVTDILMNLEEEVTLRLVE